MSTTKFNMLDAYEPLNVLLFWSGGAKSTYLLLQDLIAGHSVTCTYVTVVNAGEVSAREKQACTLLREDIKKFCEHFQCEEPYYRPDHVLHAQISLQGCKAPESTILTMFALLTGAGYDDIQLGNNAIYSFDNTQRWNDLLTEVYRRKYDDNFPNITRPNIEVSLEQIYLTLKGYDDLLGTHFIEHVTSCSRIHGACDANDKCPSCEMREFTFERLGWINPED